MTVGWGWGRWRCKRARQHGGWEGTLGGVKTLFAESGCAGSSDPSIRVISGDV